MNEYQRTVKLDITDLLSDYDAESIVGTIDDARTIFELFVRLGIEHKSTSYSTMHKYGYDRARYTRTFTNAEQTVTYNTEKDTFTDSTYPSLVKTRMDPITGIWAGTEITFTYDRANNH